MTWAGTATTAPLEPIDAARDFTVRVWRFENGLPENRIEAVLPASDGYLWVGGASGLARFDGVRFTTFTPANCPWLSTPVCQHLSESPNGELWLGTLEGVLRFGASHQPTASAAGPAESSSLPVSYPIDANHCLPFTHSDGLFVATDRKLCLIRSNRVEGVALPHVTIAIQGLAASRDGALWIASEQGLFRRTPRTGEIETIPLPRPDQGTFVHALTFDPRDRLVCLIGTVVPRAARLWRKARDQWELLLPDTLYNHERPLFLHCDRASRLWFPHEGRLCVWSEATPACPYRLPFAPAPDYPQALAEDREGHLWVGSERNGLLCLRPRQVQTLTASDGLAADNAWAVCESRDGAVWMGSDGGLSRWHEGRFTTFTTNSVEPARLARNEVRALAEDPAGTLWVGTLNGLDSLRDGAITHHRFPGEWFETKIRALLATRDGALWVGTVRGLTRLHANQRTQYTEADGLGAQEVRTLLEDRDGDLWIGTFGGGLSRFHQGRFLTLTVTNGLSSTNVWALHADANGVLWVRTDNGLNRLKDGRFTAFTTREGLPANPVNSILEDDFGRFWISHDRGLYWVWKRDLEAVAAGQATTVKTVRYDESDGLPGTEFNGQKSQPAGCKTHDGRLWFPTTKGVVVLDPARVAPEELPPVPVVEQVRANGQVLYDNSPAALTPTRAAGPVPSAVPSPTTGQSATPASPPPIANDQAPSTNHPPTLHSSLRTLHSSLRPLRLPPGSARVLELRYTAASFIAPDKVRFRHRLLGLSDHWIDAGSRREAYSTELRPGDYQFEVMACNHHGVWPDGGAIFAFHVAPFVYQTWWFYAVCGLAAAAETSGLVAWRLREVRKLHRLERLHALDEQRQRIARDIHDELGASLTQILQLSAETRKNLAEPTRAEADTQRITSLAEEAVDHIGEIVCANNPKYDRLEDLVAYLREYAANFFASTPVQLVLEFPETVPTRTVTGLFRRHLLLLVKEALQNIAKHAAASRVEVRLALRGDGLDLRIADNGRGFAPGGEAHRANGLANMRQRAAELNGSFDLESAPGQGTTIRVIVPLSHT